MVRICELYYSFMLWNVVSNVVEVLVLRNQRSGEPRPGAGGHGDAGAGALGGAQGGERWAPRVSVPPWVVSRGS